MKAVIQAGGKGTRLRPYTLVLPKPLMPVGESPIIEVLLKWLRRWGVSDVWITVGYLGGLIRTLCGDGCQWDMSIQYSEEKEPLGTIGPLKLIQKELNDTFITINGDIISDLNLREFINFHKQHDGLFSVAVTEKKIKIDLGVLEGDNGIMAGFKEKPSFDFTVSMGTYCMDPEILDLIPKNVPYGFDDLMYAMLDQGLPVYMYHHKGLWLDIGREEDFRSAQKSFIKDYKMMVLGC
jgi:mannose-1-phosphate guanylyltransferase